MCAHTHPNFFLPHFVFPWLFTLARLVHATPLEGGEKKRGLDSLSSRYLVIKPHTLTLHYTLYVTRLDGLD